MDNLHRTIATELSARPAQVEAAVRLLDEGATVPFVARYRKEATGGLDDVQLRKLEARLHYLREFEQRRAAILKAIDEQGKLTPQLRAALGAAATKTELEDLYLPYKKKRRTKGQIAREAGLEPLALELLGDPSQDPVQVAAAFVDAGRGVPDAEAALDGARHILIEKFAEDAALLGELRKFVVGHGVVRSRCVRGKESEARKFADYFDYDEPLARVPPHRALALFRGRKDGLLRVELVIDVDAAASAPNEERCVGRIAARFDVRDVGRPADAWLRLAVRAAWRTKILLTLTAQSMAQLRERAEAEAIRVFGRNLRDLLLAAPAGRKTVIGLDPGLRTGVKVAVVDATGKVVDTGTIYPHAPRNRWSEACAAIAKLAAKHKAAFVSIGNGTASRETDRLVGAVIAEHPELGLTKIVVSEAGASVYSASEIASDELPDLDVSIRGAVSIARRLQDPLAELVKIEPKAIGVGQYQHDVGQTQLAKCLTGVVEDCVNAVGVNVNTASAPLLSRVSGLTPTLARNIVAHRDANGAFQQRRELKKVARLGAKAFEQAAGFLRIPQGTDPLDASGVHPEAYSVVKRMAKDAGCRVAKLIGASDVLAQLDPSRYTDETFGLPTVTDILAELDKPGRDPRPEFVTAEFREGVEELRDLVPDMVLEGVVTNVTNFGAFVDIGVHQDGLVHISCLSDKFVKDPHEVVKPGQVVKVKVMSVDLERKRIGLSMRLADSAGSDPARIGRLERGDRARPARRPEPEIESPLAAQLAKLRKRH